MSLTERAPVSSSFLEHDEAQLHLQRRGEGHVALDALLDVVFRVLELVGDVFQHRALVEILDREDRLETPPPRPRPCGRRDRRAAGTVRRRSAEPRSGSASARPQGCRPNDLRIRFLPVKDCAIFIPNGRGKGIPRAMCPCVHPRNAPGQERRTPEYLSSPKRTPRALPRYGRRAAGRASEHKRAKESRQRRIKFFARAGI